MNTSLFRLGESRPGRYLRSLLAPGPAAPLLSPLPVGPQPKILLVDDDPVILKALTLKLTAQGYAVVTALDASAAIGAVRDERPDLVVLDLDFPPDVANGGRVTWDGFQIMSWLRGMREGLGLPFIILTGSTAAEEERRARASGAVAFFCKPVPTDELLATMARCLPQGKPTPAQQAA